MSQATQQPHKLRLKKLCFSDIKDSIFEINPNLAGVLASCSKSYGLILASYCYGNKIVSRNQLNLPTTNGSSLALNSENVPNNIAKLLSYNKLPLGLVLSKTAEQYYETDKRIIPKKLFVPGELLGLTEFVNRENKQNITDNYHLSSGARTVFMLPKIADGTAHGKIKRDYGISAYPPKNLMQQAKVFSDIAKATQQKHHWQCDILFFTSDWLNEKRLYDYCAKKAWKQSLNAQTAANFDPAWEEFSTEVTRRNIKPKPYIINTLKHILALSRGELPGFMPANNLDDSCLPTQAIQEVYLRSYQLKKYYPSIMVPSYFNKTSCPIYYSLSFPTLLEYAPQAGNLRSIMSNMRELKQMLRILLHCYRHANQPQQVTIDFFHSDIDKLSEIRHASEIPSVDECVASIKAKHDDYEFADNSTFFNGCVQIR